MRQYLLLLTIFCLSLNCIASELMQTKIFNPAFQTLKVSSAENFMGIPVIRMNSEDRVNINFDELSDDNSYLQYRLLHCNADWTVSQLVESEYLTGFNMADITDYAFSSNTYQHYVNYNILIPNEDINPKVSGNYMIQVYNPDDPDETILQARFCVSENAFPISASVTSATDKGFNTEYQQVNVALSLGNFHVQNPFSDLLLVVNQNGRPETARFIKNPLRVSGTNVIYEHINDLIFPASNEYRRFETVRVNYPGMGIEQNVFDDVENRYHAILNLDKPRKNYSHSFDQTQKGRFMIDEYNSTDPNLGADYVTTHFTLQMPEIEGSDIYVDGEFARALPPDATKMTYDRENHYYYLDIALKQGSYNYQYAVQPRNKAGKLFDTSIIEGNKYETQNEYQLFVYLRRPGDRFDRLLSVAQIFYRN